MVERSKAPNTAHLIPKKKTDDTQLECCRTAPNPSNSYRAQIQYANVYLCVYLYAIFETCIFRVFRELQLGKACERNGPRTTRAETGGPDPAADRMKKCIEIYLYKKMCNLSAGLLPKPQRVVSDFVTPVVLHLRGETLIPSFNITFFLLFF